MVLGQGSLPRWTAPAGPWREPDLHLFPQDGHRYEIVDGSLHVTPPQDERHAAVVRGLVAVLRGAAPDGWWVCDRLGVQAGASNLVPDVTVLRPHSSGACWSDPADVALVVEVESPATRRVDRLLKPAVYADAGIAGYWRVETETNRPVLRLYRRAAGGAYTLTGTVEGAGPITVDTPYPIRLDPMDWVG